MHSVSTEIQIHRLTHDYQAWDQYVLANSEASLYHRTGWKRVIEHTFGHATAYLYASQHGRIVGILPIVLLKSRLFGTFGVSLPFLNYGGLVAENDAIRRRLLDDAIAWGQQHRAAHLELRHTHPYDLGLPTKTSKVLMILDLPGSPDDLWTSFKSKLRSQIRRPQKEGCTVKFGQWDELDNFYAVFAQKMRDLGTPVHTKRLFQQILQEFPDSARICTVYADAQPVASGFLVGDDARLQIPWAASIRAYDRVGVNMLLYWTILKSACEQDYKQFDFGRSTPHEGTYKFKAQWGATPVQCYWHYWLAPGVDLPELNPQNPKYQQAIRIWQRLPVAVTKIVGPRIVKYLP
ncbi:FemAB family PEP-CTERM system-associated protein [candidate division KSB3 bacterium]|uniref:FemAB family PEP-CTERM system-associated protein n=1 Tax=candidate division KSB3 bacterium TaxID=2044937 RepID=A0A9D5JYB4_9BACT|nr:FemAB family PEP-CTERM system-associated protein [candidate division KSB3 bacterium]MBD3326226.1 FemAB family PEP-CTERM system-associated protein [candidate division KSB3 bacterium]